ncbi:MAG: dihydroorotase [Nitrospinae bacterium]|nr:dihydroorotase [Nitrospinota bacterium]
MTGRMLITGGRVVDPSSGFDGVADVLLENGAVASVAPSIPSDGARVINAKGLVVSPGFIDLHAHLREPGDEYKETILSGSMAAAAGGFTAVCCMANTKPVNDNGSITRYILEKASQAKGARVYPIGAATKGLEGKELAEIGEMKQAGVVALSDDGRCVMNARLFQNALRYASMFGLTVVEHCEDVNLAKDGVINEGEVSARLGIKGVPAPAETVVAGRDVEIAAYTGCRVHLAHISAKETVSAVRAAKARGVRVTCEATPHHFTLTEKRLETFDANFKMNPPLRREEDVAAIRRGLADGTIDAIATDHAPHLQWEKELEIDQAPNGVVGLETALGVSMSLVLDGTLSLGAMIALLTNRPAGVFGLPGGTLARGAPADVAVFDPEKSWVVDPHLFLSKGKNSPFAGTELRGKNLVTIVGGEIVYNPTDL